MIGKMNIAEPEWDEAAVAEIERLLAQGEQDYQSALIFGLRGLGVDWPEARLYLAYCCARQNPDDGATWLAVADVHGELGEWDAAEEIVRELMRLGGPGLFAEVFREDLDVRLAYILAAKGRWDEAHTALMKAEARQSDHPMFHYLAATLLHELAFRDESLSHYEKALDLLEKIGEEDLDGAARLRACAYVRKWQAAAAAGCEFAGQRPLDIESLGVE
ncbi:MAG: hypothetical protein N3A66_07525 [Planctomycetota bacterium]|nr:hypothetical protein [Planctomycetota bacterium]